MSGRIMRDEESQAWYDRVVKPWDQAIDYEKQQIEIARAHEEAIEEDRWLRKQWRGPPAPFVFVEKRPDRLPDWKEYPAPEPRGDLSTFGEPLRAGQ